MKITGLAPLQHRPNYVKVFVDGKLVGILGLDDVAKLGLNQAQEISSEQLNKIVNQSRFAHTLNAALHFLSFRPRSEWEVRQYLRRKCKDVAEETVDEEQIIQKLKDLELINDEKFAQWWVEQRSTFRPKGQRAINTELARKGVKVRITVKETVLAEKLLAKRVFSSKEQAYRYLLNRGFSLESIKSVIAKAKIKS